MYLKKVSAVAGKFICNEKIIGGLEPFNLHVNANYLAFVKQGPDYTLDTIYTTNAQDTGFVKVEYKDQYQAGGRFAFTGRDEYGRIVEITDGRFFYHGCN